MGDEKKILQEALKLDPSSKIYLVLANLYLQDRQFEEARNVLEQGLKFYPDSIDTILTLLTVYKEIGELNKASDLVNSILSRLMKNNCFWEILAEKNGLTELPVLLLRVVFERKDLDWNKVLISGIKNVLGESWDDYEEVVEDLDFDQRVITPSLGEVLFAQGEYEKARDVFEKLKQNALTDSEKQKWQDKIEEINQILTRESRDLDAETVPSASGKEENKQVALDKPDDYTAEVIETTETQELNISKEKVLAKESYFQESTEDNSQDRDSKGDLPSSEKSEEDEVVELLEELALVLENRS
ncbi:MAG: tetratricopeptide repeat protein [Desulfonauticus sp.]|nr:tetratricopeptide repeat protein [Desulfonauticus sp.]